MSSDMEICKVSGRTSNLGKPHRARTASEQGEIYMIRNKINKKKYIGQAYSFKTDGKPHGAKERWNGHKHDARVLHKRDMVDQLEETCDDLSTSRRGCRALSHAINKYGEQNFELEIILMCGADQLDHYEAVFIDLHNSLASNGRGYNLKSGGNGNGRADDTTRKLMSEAHSGDKHHCFGVPCPEETKAKISATLSNITRYDVDLITELPRYMKTLNDAGNVGYVIVGHPLLAKGIRAQFSSNRIISDSDSTIVGILREKTIFYLNHLNACFSTGDQAIPKLTFMKTFRGHQSS